MKELNEILNFVTSEFKTDAGFFQKIMGSGRPGSDQKMFKLINGIHYKSFKNDDEASKSLYGSAGAGTSKYRMLKARLKNRLIDMVFMPGSDMLFKNPYNKSFFQVSRNILAAQMLLLKDNRSVAISLLKSALQSALQFEHTQQAVLACRMLCYHAAYTGNSKDLQYYNGIHVKQQMLLKRELEMENLYNSILSFISGTSGYDQTALNVLKRNYKKAEKIYASNSSHLVKLGYHRIAVLYYHSQRQFETVIQISRRFFDYLISNPHLLQNARAGEFALYEMESCMRLRQFEQGKQCAERCLQYFAAYSTPWIQFQEYYFLLAMRTDKTEEALKIFISATSSYYKFKTLPKIQQERWRINEAFLNFSLPDELPKKQFNLFRFLNEIKLATHDKAGYNFIVLIAQIILLINISEYGHLCNIEYSFRKYLKRYIKKNRHPRHYNFGCMLRILFQNNFSFKNIDEKIKPHLEKLIADHNHPNPLEESEIIPYEKLWERLKEKVQGVTGSRGYKVLRKEFFEQSKVVI